MLRPLTNTFGFETNCFVCDPGNRAGLRVPFFLDEEHQTVLATVRLGTDFSGAPTLVHGGVLAALCDDALAWASIVLARRFALTAESRLRYLEPVPCDREFTVSARVIGLLDEQIWATSEIRIGETVHVRAEARLTVLGGELAAGMGVLTDEQGSVPDQAAPR